MNTPEPRGRRSSMWIMLLIQCAWTFTTYAESWTRHTIDDSSIGADGVRLADANGDGLLDIATPWEEGNIVRVYLHPGAVHSKGPWPSVTVGRVVQPEDAVLVDLDRDGSVDVVSSCEGTTRTVFVHWAPADAQEFSREDAWTTQPIPATQNRVQWMFCLPFDVDSDGDMDLVLGSKNEGAGVGWLLCPDEPRDLKRWEWRPVYSGGWIMSLRARDIDNDGKMDILLSDRRGENAGLHWFKRSSAGDVWSSQRIGPAHAAEVMFLWGGRLGGSKTFHVVVGANTERTLFHLQRDPSRGTWSERSASVPGRVGRPKGVAVADLNEDGAYEIVLSCEDANDRMGLAAFELETLEFAFDIGGKAGTKFDRIELIDIDRDGDRDVLACEEREGLGVVWYENPLR